MILRNGSRGSQVRELQELLKENGFWTFHTITDFFGNVTETAVKEFQKAKGLKDDGLVGPRTWKELLKEKEVKITPTYKEVDNNEDFSDPEEEMVVGTEAEAEPGCKNTSELINLINDSNITRKVTRLVFHCTATQPTATVTAIQNHWRNKLGWRNPGYHILVRPDGSWTQLSDFNNVTNGVGGINSTSLHISYIGGIDKNGKAIDNRTEEQRRIFEAVYHTFKDKMPNLTFHGHYEFSNKACPCFKVDKWIESIQM